ncbi:hypothetical protein OIU77_021300 [Salix suchowensis]|uniref:Uncharacterized protein n=1 Tax=Salix suchowensis TaxID=1278906 RepID=A0ABQ9CCC7_9ROSI|nr:hypothetical protein OIU77_021300 [Salix suchowensis]
MKVTQKEEEGPAEQAPVEVKESTNMGSGDHDAKLGKMGQPKEVVDTTSPTPQASTSLKQTTDPCGQDKQNGKAPQTSQEASSGPGKAGSEFQEKGKWPSEDEEIIGGGGSGDARLDFLFQCLPWTSLSNHDRLEF